MKVPWLDLKAQDALLREEISAATDKACAAQFILGARVQVFEAYVACYCVLLKP